MRWPRLREAMASFAVLAFRLGVGRQKSQVVAESGEGRIRTGDTTIFSRVLYQLSYLAWTLNDAQREG